MRLQSPTLMLQTMEIERRGRLALLGVLAVALGAGWVALAPQHGDVTVLLVAMSGPLLLLVLPFAAMAAVQKLRALARQLSWWHVLWLLIALSGLVFRVRDNRDLRADPIDAWAVSRMLIVGVTALVLGVRFLQGHTR